jgi:hypothetical protein
VTLIEAQANGLPIVCSDSITKEVDVLNSIKYCSLDQKEKTWVSCVESNQIRRFDFVEKLIQCGYDINVSSKMLQNFYLDINVCLNKDLPIEYA